MLIISTFIFKLLEKQRMCQVKEDVKIPVHYSASGRHSNSWKQELITELEAWSYMQHNSETRLRAFDTSWKSEYGCLKEWAHKVEGGAANTIPPLESRDHD